MKSRQGVARCDLDQVPVTFLDVAAYFSEEEWKLLHEWQKDLYNNVMKEIQQALVSLGPLIANSVFSLRPKEKDHHCPLSNRDSELTDHINISPNFTADSDVVFSKVNKVHLDLKTAHDCNQRVRYDVPSSETAPAVSFIIKTEEEEAVCSINRLDPLATERSESITNTTTPEVSVPVELITINEDGVNHPLNVQDYSRRTSVKRSTAVGTMERKWKNEDPVKYSKKALQCEATLGNSKAKVVQRSEKSNHCISPLWSECNWKPGEKVTQCASDIMNDAQSSLHQTMLNIPTAIIKDESISHLWGHENRQNKWGSFNFLGSEESFRQYSSVAEHQRSQAESSLKVKRFSCAECKKSFIQKIHLIRHQRTHSGEKPYHCTECEKSFSHKHILIGHLRKHSGERPFQCMQCMKSFSWKEGLRRHQRTHTSHT